MYSPVALGACQGVADPSKLALESVIVISIECDLLAGLATVAFPTAVSWVWTGEVTDRRRRRSGGEIGLGLPTGNELSSRLCLNPPPGL